MNRRPGESRTARSRTRLVGIPGGIIHAYQKYNPTKFPSPTAPPPDVASSAFEHMLRFGSMRRFTEAELAEAIHIDPSQIAGLGPSLDALIAMLEERKAKILGTYETDSVLRLVDRLYEEQAASMQPPDALAGAFARVVREQQIRDIERLWYKADTARRAVPPQNTGQRPLPPNTKGRGPLPPEERFARDLLHLGERLGEKYQIEQLASEYGFTGRTPMDVPRAFQIKKELEAIDRLLEQLREALKNAKIGLIDMEELSRFAQEADVEQLRAFQEQIGEYLRQQAELQGLEHSAEGYRLGPRAFRIFQSRLLDEIFSELQAARSGRHSGPIVGDGAVEMTRTKPYEFGDSVTHMDVPQSIINALIREGTKGHRDKGTEGSGCNADRTSDDPLCPRASVPLSLSTDDIEIHHTRNNPKCATCLLMDMSGSMRYDGQYIQAKRMALALDGLIRSEYPGDFLRFIEIYSFAKVHPISEIPALMPKPVTVREPIVRLKADMSRDDITEFNIPPHFTNIQHALRLARQFLGAQDTPNRQIILITDGLPTAHFEGQTLYLLYPPDPATEEATMREAARCVREGITINIFLLPNWWQSSEDVQFAHRLAEQSGGRVFFTGGSDLDRFVLWDYVSHRRTIIG